MAEIPVIPSETSAVKPLVILPTDMEGSKDHATKEPLFAPFGFGLPDPPASAAASAFKKGTLSMRPRTKVRRTQSMFQHLGDFLAQERSREMEEELDSTPSSECRLLPCFGVSEDGLKRIDKETLCGLQDGKFGASCAQHMIIDCRFPYEYTGGHVLGAINVNTMDALESLLLSSPPRPGHTILIFHCEYSAQRAPRMALHLRNADRHQNMHRYPQLFYPEIYILAGGYSTFYANHRSRCEPQSYIEMNHHLHQKDCAREMSLLKRNARFVRTQSYTFGALPQHAEVGSNGSPCPERLQLSHRYTCQ